jgi:16S rRNA (cytidine1402-2'-O)-methyltransferase
MIIKPQSKIKSKENGLYLVSTPIGNLKDITLRALEVLKKSDIILCEDTRVSKKLLDKYEIKSKLISNHKFNEKKNVAKIIGYLKTDKIVSLISDAGTPAVSDPGSVLVNQCVENNIRIYPIPGPSAVSAAVSISGFSDQFFFYGFFPEKKQQIEREFKKLSKLNSTLVFFASTKKINKVIHELKHYFAGRKIVFCREITKFYEEFVREDIDKLELFKKDQKGELTVVISEISNNKNISQKLRESDIVRIKNMINEFTVKEIISKIRKSKNISKKEIYNFCISLKNEK